MWAHDSTTTAMVSYITKRIRMIAMFCSEEGSEIGSAVSGLMIFTV